MDQVIGKESIHCICVLLSFIIKRMLKSQVQEMPVFLNSSLKRKK